MRDLNVTSLTVHLRNAAPSRPTCVLIAFFALAVTLDNLADAQVHSQAPPGGPPGARPGMMPPGMMPGGRQPTGAPIPGSATGGRGPAPEFKFDPDKLPDNYVPPAVKDPVMEIDNPLTDDLDKLKKDLAKYGTSMRTARSTDADKVLIRNGLRYRLALMTLKDNRVSLSKLHDDLLRDLNSAALAPDVAKASNVRDFRQLVLRELLSQVTPLLTSDPDLKTTQNFYVRMHLVILLGELNITEENTKLALTQEAYAPVCEPLLNVVTDPRQPEAIKIVAVNGLVRVLRLGNVTTQVRSKIAEGLVAELKNKKAYSWYQMRLAGALAFVDVDLDQSRAPSVAILRAILADDERTWAVRAEAAKSLGRVHLPTTVNPPVVTQDIAAFALKLAKAAQQAPPQNARDPKWRSEFFKVYLAFQPLDATDLMADKKGKAGLLNNPAANAKPAYNLIVPLVAGILHGQRLTVQAVQTLEAYVTPAPAQTEIKPPSPMEVGKQ
ncbi:MAG: hypothetical protein JSS49_18740 [Planctomycetes bacterium]|nr:hypothetical protein [Planctomycetota bacterium]